MMSRFWFAALLLFPAPGLVRAEGGDTPAAAPPNVLMIAIDDMNDWVGFLGGHPQAQTPNLDRLAQRSVNFTNAHCVSPACSPSRLALLLGVQPFHSGFYPFYNHQKITADKLNQYTSLPAAFRQSGYRSFGAGKIFHGYKELGNHWDDYHKANDPKLNYNAKGGYQINKSRKMAFCPTTNPLEDHPDFQVTNYGIDVLNQQHEKPFFLAVGIVKPHLPFVCPQQFFDLYSDPVQAPPIKNRDLGDVPPPGRAMASLKDDLKFRTDKAWEDVRRAYLACNSWVDFNVGRLLEALENSPYAENTIVILWSDHGYHFGEKRSFRKFSLWEEATRVPLIVHDPRPGRMQAGSCSEAVSLIHVYRTLAEMTDMEVPDSLDGTSLVPQIQNPATPLDAPAITTWGRGNYSVRDDHVRYTRYFDGSEELYDHRQDPQEWVNLVNDPQWQAQRDRLRKFLPQSEAPLHRPGVALWNVIDADRPERLDKFLQETWPNMRRKLRPPIE